MTFAESLKQHLESKSRLTRGEERVIEVLKMRPSKKKERILRAMESHVRAHFGESNPVRGDWESFDWATLLPIVLKIIVTLLPLLLAL